MLQTQVTCAGDFIGACLNRVDKTISYFKNGIDLGVAFHNVLEEQLFPCIGMQTHEEEVRTFSSQSAPIFMLSAPLLGANCGALHLCKQMSWV